MNEVNLLTLPFRVGNSGAKVIIRSWCNGSDYRTVYFNLNETVYQMLKERGFMFPFNRLDVNIINQKENHE